MKQAVARFCMLLVCAVLALSGANRAACAHEGSVPTLNVAAAATVGHGDCEHDGRQPPFAASCVSWCCLMVIDTPAAPVAGAVLDLIGLRVLYLDPRTMRIGGREAPEPGIPKRG